MEQEEYIPGEIFVKELKKIDEASVMDLVGGKKIFWVMKKIILDQQKRLDELEFLVAELRGEVEPDEDQKLSL